MNEETQMFTAGSKPSHDSRVYNVSIRGWLAVMLTVTVCTMSGFSIEVKEPLYSIATFAIGFYFGQKVPTNK